MSPQYIQQLAKNNKAPRHAWVGLKGILDGV